jgi:5'-nucleotidase
MRYTHHRIWGGLVFVLAVAAGLNTIRSLGATVKLAPGIQAQSLRGLGVHGLESVAILGLNDFHGALAARVNKIKNPTPDQPPTFESGGASVLASYVRILREEFGSRFLLIDAGDQWQGTLESNLEEGAPVVKFFNLIGMSAAAIGNHEFDFGPVGPEGTEGDRLGAMKARFSEAQYPYLNANIRDKASGQLTSLPNTLPSVILTAGGVKVGVIGLTTRETAVTTRQENVKDLDFADLREATLREAASLRAKGANLVIVTSHAGLVCNDDPASLKKNMIRTPTTEQGACGDDEEIPKLIQSLPEGTLDAVIAGHTHRIVHHWVKGVPVVQGAASGQYFNILYLTFDHSTEKTVPSLTRLEGPVPVCPMVFEVTQNCEAGGEGRLVPTRFRGARIEPDPTVEAALAETFKKTAELKKKIVGSAARVVRHNSGGESELGNLVADAIRAKTQADVAMVNPYGIRVQQWDEGQINFDTVYRTLPFDNFLSVLTVTGQELRNLVRVANSGAFGVFDLSGLKVEILGFEVKAPSDDLDLDGKFSPWEANRLLDIKLADGSELIDSKLYRFATIDFLVTGGDNLFWPMSQIPKERIQLNAGGFLRDAVVDFLAKHSPVNLPSRPLIDPAKPRVRVVRP